MADEVILGMNRADFDATIALITKKPTVDLGNLTYDATNLVLAYTEDGATARSSSTCGTGTATRRYLAAAGASRDVTATADTEAIAYYNLSTTTVGTAKYILLARLGADYVCVWEEC